ncbi:arylacetamide deacetylase-like 4 [Grammomys surdaster]|uniref:arylacetamide deacetylase-like 4 n=1 Tax=Grammomys surdaster TaxID=491861 RepID=UPI0010A02BA7|nr:arylacetamide deacetylase-like 4 [Grammomys surdaster]
MNTMLYLLGFLLTTMCLLVLGVNVWVLIDHLLTIDVPPSIPHPMKFRILHYCFHLTTTWGDILEKMNICSMPQFFNFVHDSLVLKENLGVFVKDLYFGTIPVRLFHPKAASSKPRRGIIFFHGGGALIGSLDYYHNLCAFLARETDSVLMSVGYRKLPYYHHPSLYYDCLNASIHFLKSLKAYGVDRSRVVICGDSIGGGAAVAIIQTLLGRTDIPKIRAQVLIYPILQAFYFQSPSHLMNRNIPFLTKDFLITCVCKYLAIDRSWKDAMLTGACISPSAWKKYEKWLSPDNIPKRFRTEYQRHETPFNEAAYLETRHTMNVDISPLIADDKIIAQLPEAFIVSLHWDIIRDDVLLYKKRLEDQGVPVTWHHVEDGFHGCILFFEKKFFSFPCSLNIVNAVVSYIKSL